MIFGIISVPKKKYRLIDRLMRPIKTEVTFGNSPEYIVAELAFCQDDIAKMSIKKLKRILDRAELMLKNQGAVAVFFSEDLKQCLNLKQRHLLPQIRKSFKIPPSRIFEAYNLMRDSLAEYSAPKHEENMTIIDGALNAVTPDVIANICTDAKKITIKTNKKDKAQKIEHIIFCEYGIILNVTDIDEEEVCKAQVLIDVDKGKIRIGDRVADGAEFVSGATAFGISSSEEAYYLGNDNLLAIKTLLSGKNKIKIS